MDDKPALNELPALLAEELARIDGLNPVTRDIIRGILDDAVDRAEEAEARVAELEAQLAAQQWRPAAEEPSEPGYYLVILRDWLWPCEIQRWEGPGPFGPNGWTIEIRDRVVAWQPLPDAPQEPPQ